METAPQQLLSRLASGDKDYICRRRAERARAASCAMALKSVALRRKAFWLCSIVTTSNRSGSPGRLCATIGMSAAETTAIFGYPPTVGASAIKMIGCPSPGTWIAPGQAASEGSDPGDAPIEGPSIL